MLQSILMLKVIGSGYSSVATVFGLWLRAEASLTSDPILNVVQCLLCYSLVPLAAATDDVGDVSLGGAHFGLSPVATVFGL